MTPASSTLQIRLHLQFAACSLTQKLNNIASLSLSSLFIDGFVHGGSGSSRNSLSFSLRKDYCHGAGSGVPRAIIHRTTLKHINVPSCKTEHLGNKIWTIFSLWSGFFLTQLPWICISANNSRTPAELITGQDETNEADPFFIVSV